MKRNSILLFLTFLLIGAMPLRASVHTPSPDSSSQQVSLVRDSPILAMLDSLVNVKLYRNFSYTPDVFILNKYKYPFDYVPVFSDEVYRERMEKLAMNASFKLVFNDDVKEFIDLYAVRKKALTSKILGLTRLYFPLFEEMLDRYNLPLELKYLAVIESALNPVAKSKAGASGLWQFIIGTGKLYNLRINSVVDERCDPYKSTEAACQHLRDLYDIYGDWALALAAYNSGAGNVNKAIRRSGGKMDFWEIRRFLPRETRGYVPAFIAVNYVLNYATEHNIYPMVPRITDYEVDTVTVRQKVTLSKISEFFSLPPEDLAYLNPAYKKDIIPASEDDYYVLRLPKTRVGEYINSETALYNYKTSEEIQLEQTLMKNSLASVQNKGSRLHVLKTCTVRKGESLKSIARKYDCTVEELMDWNKLKFKEVRPKQKLIVLAVYEKPSPPAEEKETAPKDTLMAQTQTVAAPAAAKTSGSGTQSVGTRYIYHTVQKGDTLWEIAARYKGVTVEQIKNLNNIRDSKSLRPGQKLKVAVSS